VAESDEPWAALGAESAARLYGAAVLRHGVEDEPDNITRFVWVAPEGTSPTGSGPWRTSLVFSELGEDHPGALVDALQVFSDRAVNLTRIESRPLRRGLGRYQFFLDIEGASSEDPVDSAIQALRSKAESVRVLGSWPIAVPPGVPG
jgi:prephenate dehydratase